MIRDEDVRDDKKLDLPQQDESIADMVAKLVSDDFNPTTNEMDARIFYEITGERLPGFEAILRDEDSSDSDTDDPPGSPTSVSPLAING